MKKSNLKKLLEGWLTIAFANGWSQADALAKIASNLDEPQTSPMWRDAIRAKMIDPNVARTREMNLLKAYPTTYNRMNPLRHRETRQLWTLTLPEAYRRGAHTVEVEAADRWGFTATGRRSFCFPKTAR